MRDIKFRAWNIKEERMTQNIQQEYDGIEEDCFAQFIEKKGKYHVMQYTGLKDKNGVEIYEGDLIISDHWQSDEHMVVSWDCHSCKFYASLPDGGDWIDLDEAKKLVVGNIFEGVDK